MIIINKIKQFSLAYVPDMKSMRDLSNKIRYTNNLENKRSRLEECLLPTLTDRLLQKLTPFENFAVPFIRVGNKSDGGYVMGDIFDKVDVAYSFEIVNDVTWDTEIADRLIPVFMYGHTIDRLLEEHEKFYFFKTGICGKLNIASMKDIGMLIK